MKRLLYIALFLPIIACESGPDPVADAQQVCDCFDEILDNPESDVDCQKLIHDMGEKYAEHPDLSAAYAQAYNDCLN